MKRFVAVFLLVCVHGIANVTDCRQLSGSRNFDGLFGPGDHFGAFANAFERLCLTF